MTPEERASFQHLGVALVPIIPPPVIYTLSLGVATGLFAVWMYLNLGRGLGTLQGKIILAIMTATYLLHVINTFGQVLVLKGQIRGVLVDQASAGAITQAISPFRMMSLWGENFQFVVYDSIVVWRAWILYRGRNWARLAPCFLLAGTIVLMVLSVILSSTPATELWAGTKKPISPTIFDQASFCSSLATNLVATALILHRLKAQRRLNLGEKGSMTRGQQVLLVLMESGLLFFSIQAIDIALVFVPQSTISNLVLHSVCDTLFWASMPSFSFVVFIIVQAKVSMIETYGFNSTGSENVVPDAERALGSPTAVSVPKDLGTITSRRPAPAWT